MDILLTSLSAEEFEDFACDLIERHRGIDFERASSKKDEGIDGLYETDNDFIIVQVKHYHQSGFRKLLAKVKQEIQRPRERNPTEYILATSLSLTRGNKREIKNSLEKLIAAKVCVYGAEDICSFARKNSDIISQYRKISADDLSMHENYWVKKENESRVGEARYKDGFFADYPDVQVARKILDENNSIIITGGPGMGKTSLAFRLLLQYADIGWAPFIVNDFRKIPIIDNKKQIIFFDDIFGSIQLDLNNLSMHGQRLLMLLKKAKASETLKVILTVRSYIIQEAQIKTESLKDVLINLITFKLKLSMYNLNSKGSILHNHLRLNKVSRMKIQSLIDAGSILKIIEHRKFIPRIVELMTDATKIDSISTEDYPGRFLHMMDNPDEIWETAFCNMSIACQHLLISLFFENSKVSRSNTHERNFQLMHSHICLLNTRPTSFVDYHNSIKILTDGFIKIRNVGKSLKKIEFNNPSLEDYLAKHINNSSLLLELPKCAQCINWASRLWRYGRKNLENKDLILFCRSFENCVEMYFHLPMDELLPVNTFTGSFYVGYRRYGGREFGLSYIDRLQLILEFWSISYSPIYESAVRKLVYEPPKNWALNFGELNSALETITSFQSNGEYAGFPNSSQFCELLECMLAKDIRGYTIHVHIIERIGLTLKKYSKVISNKIIDSFNFALVTSLKNLSSEYLKSAEFASNLQDELDTINTPQVKTMLINAGLLDEEIYKIKQLYQSSIDYVLDHENHDYYDYVDDETLKFMHEHSKGNIERILTTFNDLID